jgi:Family of unknown function (DUF5681)
VAKFEKGQSGNPKGRPKGSGQSFRAKAREFLDKNNPDFPHRTRNDHLLDVIWEWIGKDGERAIEFLKFIHGSSPPLNDRHKPELNDAEPTDDDGNSIDP